MGENDTYNNYESQELINYSKVLFDRHATDFDTLDNKALGIIGIAGLLVGFQVLNINMLSELVMCILNNQFQWIPSLALLALVIHGICLIGCILKALASFQIKDFYYPDTANKLLHKVGNRKKILTDIVDTYSEVAEDIERINNAKASKLKYSVKSITFAILALIAFMVFMVIYKCN